MAEGIFDLLGGGVAGFGKGAEGGDVIEIAVIEGADIHMELIAGDGPQGGFLYPGGQPQADGQVIGGAERNIAHGAAILPLHHAADHFIQGAIAAAADHQIEPAGILQHLPGAIQSSAGGVDGDLVIVVGEDLDHFVEVGLGLLAAGHGIDDKQKLFHGVFSP